MWRGSWILPMFSCYAIIERAITLVLLWLLFQGFSLISKIHYILGPPALLEKPWRSHIKWIPEERHQLLEDLNSFKVKGGIPYLNCLLLGQAASGKTSFFNTSATALKDEGRLVNPLTVFKARGSSVTSKVTAIDL